MKGSVIERGIPIPLEETLISLHMICTFRLTCGDLVCCATSFSLAILHSKLKHRKKLIREYQRSVSNTCHVRTCISDLPIYWEGIIVWVVHIKGFDSTHIKYKSALKG